jgi:dethiobiotin synthetase
MNIFITATNTNIGKTYASKLLIKELTSIGYKVGIYKPIETGFINEKETDSFTLLEEAKKYNKNLENLTINDICPYQFKLPSAPIVAKKNTIISKEKLLFSLEKIKKLCDIVIIEGAGGLFVPIEKDFFMIDLIKLFQAKTLLISHSGLGSINDSILSKNALKEFDYLFCINLFKEKENFKKITYPYYKYINEEILILEKDIKSIANKLASKYTYKNL